MVYFYLCLSIIVDVHCEKNRIGTIRNKIGTKWNNSEQNGTICRIQSLYCISCCNKGVTSKKNIDNFL